MFAEPAFDALDAAEDWAQGGGTLASVQRAAARAEVAAKAAAAAAEVFTAERAAADFAARADADDREAGARYENAEFDAAVAGEIAGDARFAADVVAYIADAALNPDSAKAAAAAANAVNPGGSNRCEHLVRQHYPDPPTIVEIE